MSVVLYYMPFSPYCRAVRLGARAVDVTTELRLINLSAGDNLKPEFVAVNPQHTVPTLVDGDLVLWESRAILTYLVAQYGKDKSHLYPEDPKTRAKVDSLLYFDIGTLVPRWRAVVHPVMKGLATKPSQAALDQLQEALGWLEEGQRKHRGKFLAGTDQLTVADLALVAGVSTYEALGVFKADVFPALGEWLGRCKREIKGYEELNGADAVKFAAYIKSKITE